MRDYTINYDVQLVMESSYLYVSIGFDNGFELNGFLYRFIFRTFKLLQLTFKIIVDHNNELDGHTEPNDLFCVK